MKLYNKNAKFTSIFNQVYLEKVDICAIIY